MMDAAERFGAFIRRRREEKEIGLREMAKMIGVSATYLSKVERDEFTPPTEEKVSKIAQILKIDEDELMALAGRVPADLTEIIRERPREVAALLRTTRNLTREDFERLAQQARQPKRS